MRVIIHARAAVIEGSLQEDVCLEIKNKVIVSISSDDTDHFDLQIENCLVPGFIDLHCHGGGGNYFSDLSDSGIANVIRTHREHGTSIGLASLVTEPIEVLKQQIQRLLPFAERGEIAGIHLEGPYLAKSRCGAHDPDLLRLPTIPEIEELLSVGKGQIKMVTIAPELSGGIEAINYLSSKNVIAAMGHSAANYAQTLEGLEAGSNLITHFPNAVSKLGDEGETLAKLVMNDQRLALEIILDGHHVDDESVSRIMTAAKNRIVLVTDAMCAAGGADGHYAIGKLPVTVKDSVARLDSNGALAGSTLTMDQAFFNAYSRYGFTLPQAVAASSTVPSRILGMRDRGEIAVGKRADLTEIDLSNHSAKSLSISIK